MPHRGSVMCMAEQIRDGIRALTLTRFLELAGIKSARALLVQQRDLVAPGLFSAPPTT